MLKTGERTNRNLQGLAIVTTIFLPASLIAGIFGMNVEGLPLSEDNAGFLRATSTSWRLGNRFLVVEAVGDSWAIATPIKIRLLAAAEHVFDGAEFFQLLDRVMPDWKRRKTKLERPLA